MFNITKHIKVFELPRFKFPYCNCIWIDDDIGCLIDSSPTDEELINLTGKKIDLIVNSHGHLDHYFHNIDYPDTRVLMHEKDQAMAQSAKAYLHNFNFYAQVPDEKLHTLYMDAIHYRTTHVNANLSDGQIIETGKTHFQVLHLPGHSAGHCGFLFPDQGFVFTADLDLSPFGPWYGNINCSISELIDSIERLIELKPDFIICGHGQALIKERIISRLNEYRDIVYEREHRIVSLMYRGKHTPVEIAKHLPVYQQLPPPQQVFFLYEITMIEIHLQHLIASGKVIQDKDNYYLSSGVKPSSFDPPR